MNSIKTNNVTSLEQNQSKVIKKEMIKFFAEPLTENISKAIDAFDNGKYLILNGCPGTGKTFVILNKAIQKVLSGDRDFRHICVVRSIVPIRDIGFLKGTKDDKCSEYEAPYMQIVKETFQTNSNVIYEKLKENGVFSFEPTSFNQGVTKNDTLIIVDESQNLNYDELYNIVTRCSKSSKIYFTGDYKKQNMLKKHSKDVSGFEKFIRVVNSSQELKDYFEIITMTPEDVVRGDFCKAFVTADYNFDESK